MPADSKARACRGKKVLPGKSRIKQTHLRQAQQVSYKTRGLLQPCLSTLVQVLQISSKPPESMVKQPFKLCTINCMFCDTKVGLPIRPLCHSGDCLGITESGKQKRNFPQRWEMESHQTDGVGAHDYWINGRVSTKHTHSLTGDSSVSLQIKIWNLIDTTLATPISQQKQTHSQNQRFSPDLPLATPH